MVDAKKKKGAGSSREEGGEEGREVVCGNRAALGGDPLHIFMSSVLRTAAGHNPAATACQSIGTGSYLAQVAYILSEKRCFRLWTPDMQLGITGAVCTQYLRSTWLSGSGLHPPCRGASPFSSPASDFVDLTCPCNHHPAEYEVQNTEWRAQNIPSYYVERRAARAGAHSAICIFKRDNCLCHYDLEHKLEPYLYTEYKNNAT